MKTPGPTFDFSMHYEIKNTKSQLKIRGNLLAQYYVSFKRNSSVKKWRGSHPQLRSRGYHVLLLSSFLYRSSWLTRVLRVYLCCRPIRHPLRKESSWLWVVQVRVCLRVWKRKWHLLPYPFTISYTSPSKRTQPFQDFSVKPYANEQPWRDIEWQVYLDEVDHQPHPVTLLPLLPAVSNIWPVTPEKNPPSLTFSVKADTRALFTV